MSRAARILASLLAGGAAIAPAAAHARKPQAAKVRQMAEEARAACRPYAARIRRAERAKKLRDGVLTALLWRESRCKPDASNERTGARGIGQFVPSGAAAVGRIQRARGAARWFRYRDAFDASASIVAAAELLAYGLEVCGSLVAAVGQYNSGRCVESRFARAVLRLADAIRALADKETRT